MARIAKQAAKWTRSLNSLVRYHALGEDPRQGELIATFLRLHSRIVFSALLGRRVKRFSILGHEMRFANAHSFSFLLMELFIEESYKGIDRTPATIVDLGSNIGMSILLFKSLWPECRVLGVEAPP